MPLATTEGLNGSRFNNIQLAQTSLKELCANYDANNVYVTSHFAPIYPYAVSRNARALARNLLVLEHRPEGGLVRQPGGSRISP